MLSQELGKGEECNEQFQTRAQTFSDGINCTK